MGFPDPKSLWPQYMFCVQRPGKGPSGTGPPADYRPVGSQKEQERKRDPRARLPGIKGPAGLHVPSPGRPADHRAAFEGGFERGSKGRGGRR